MKCILFPVFSMLVLLLASPKGVAEMPDVDHLPVIDNLPDPFRFQDGSYVRTPEDWRKRREEIIALLTYYEYGHMPPAPAKVEAVETDAQDVFDGVAREIRVTLSFGPEKQVPMQVGLYVPKGKPGPFPVVLAIEPVWHDSLKTVAQRIVERGYIFAGYDRHDLDKDDADRSDGMHPLYPDYDWATLAVWAWGSLRVVDYLLTRKDVDPAHIALTGHSRAGKTALLAAALDERIALAVPHASGAGGAGCYRSCELGVETLTLITNPKRFHYWFQPRLATFSGKEDRLPFDQHFLKALVAPRALLSVEGLADLWANPKGTQRTYQAVQPVFDFLGASDKNAIHFREGGHDTTMDDWEVLLDFADHVFFNKPTTKEFNKLPFPSFQVPTFWKIPGSR